MASAAAAAAMTRAVRPTVPKAMAKKAGASAVSSGMGKKAAKSVASPFTGGKAGIKPGPFSKGNTSMLKPGYKPGGGMPNYGSNGLNAMKKGPARNAGNASTFGMTDQHMGLGDFAGGGGGSDEFSMGDSMKDFLANAALSMLSPDEQMASGGGGGGGASAGPGSAYRGGHGVDSEVTWNFGPLANLKHERI